jgi:hypothetical protein
MEVDLVAGLHGDDIRNFGGRLSLPARAVRAAAQEQGQRADDGFVGGKRRPTNVPRPGRTGVSFIVFILLVLSSSQVP